MAGTKLILTSAVAQAGLPLDWGTIDRLGIHVTKREGDGRLQIAWTSVEKLARDNFPQGGRAREAFLERVATADAMGG